MFRAFYPELNLTAAILIAAIAIWNLIEMRRDYGYKAHPYNWRVLLESFRGRKVQKTLAMLVWPMGCLIVAIGLDTGRSQWQLLAQLSCSFWLTWRAVLCIWGCASWREVKA